MFRFAFLFPLVLVGAALALRVAPAAGWTYYDPECPVTLGAKTMKFVAMQPKKRNDRVCDALPETGHAVIALDAFDSELREMNWDIRVHLDADEGQGEEKADAATVFRLPTQKFPNGMAMFDLDFASAGKYLLVAKLTSDDGAKEYVGAHRFTVGLLSNKEFYAYVFFACFFGVAGGGFLWTRKSARSRRARAEAGELQG